MASEPPALAGLNYVRPLGRGGYAEVFLYEQTNPRMRVAVKVLFAESLSPRALDQFAAEANTMAELADHPNIVQVFRSDITEDGRPYLVMKYYPQRNLAVRARTEQLSVPEVLQIGVRVGCAVETAHRAGILHRDIKPANILTSQYGEPGLTDFGIATTGNEHEAEAEGLSIPWAPPEVVFGSATASRSSDVYSLGATLWHLLVGRSPFEDPNGENASIAMMRRIREVQPPRTGRDDVPASLERLLAQTMAKSPSDRPQTALQLARALQGIESEQRWAPTPLVLLDSTEGPGDAEEEELDSGDADGTVRRLQANGAVTPGSLVDQPVERHLEVPDDESATRRRLVTVTQTPQEAPPATPPLTSAAPGRRGPRTRQGMPELDVDVGTVRRPVMALPEAIREPDSAESLPGASSRRWLVVATVVLIVALVGVGILLSQPADSKSGTTTITSGPAPTIATVTSVNAPVQSDPPTRISPTEVEFTWTIPNQQSGDRVWWVDTGLPSQAGDRQFVSSNQAIVAAPGQVCIAVYVQAGTAQSDPLTMCGGGS